MSFSIQGSASFEFDVTITDELPTPMQKFALLKHIGIVGENAIKEQAETVRASGELASSAQHEIRGDSVSAFTYKQYGDKALKDGRKPGKMPPISAIEMWKQKKGVSIPAFLIARKIARLGTNRYIQGGPDLVQRGFDNFKRQVDLIISDFTTNGRI